jgi:DNA-binding Lrp family transcriptional regulator
LTRCYILVQTEIGQAGTNVADEIAGIPGVSAAENVTGPYDVVVSAEAEDLDHLNRSILARIQQISGVTRTLTCPVVHL